MSKRCIPIWKGHVDSAKSHGDWIPFVGIDEAINVFVGYLMLDAWIANTDRHHENWALVVSPQATVHLAPSYDHASSLGAHETDANRQDRLTTRDTRRSMQRYVERATSAFFALPSDKTPMSALNAFREAGTRRRGAAKVWLECLRRIPSEDIQAIFTRIPSDRISAVATDFALSMLALNRQRLHTHSPWMLLAASKISRRFSACLAKP